MSVVIDRISLFFKKDFKKKFVIFITIPLASSVIFLADFFLLPEIHKTDVITKIGIVKIPQNVGGTSVRTTRNSGYRYTTATNLKFATPTTRIKSPEIQVTITPLFKTVKAVSTTKKKINLASGFNGLNKVLMLLCNIGMVSSILYVLLTKEITENARLNLLFLNMCTLAVWIYALILY